MSQAPLDPEIEELFAHLVERSLTVERAHRRFFVASNDATPGVFLQGGGLEGFLEAAPQDLDELEGRGLIETENYNIAGTYEFYITLAGYQYAKEISGRVEPLVAASNTAVVYIASPEFADRHPETYTKWKVAARYADDDPVANATRIGHDCREALQAFASDLARERQLEAGKGTYAAIEAAISHHRSDLGERTTDLLAALNQLWQAASGLAQRQEHGEAKSTPLDAHDARRVLWYTGLVMYELDRTLPRP